MSFESAKRPLNVLMKSMDNIVIVKLKNNLEYKGRMIKCDNYMNILLEGASESYGDEMLANYGNIFIRGNNVLYICLNVNKLPQVNAAKSSNVYHFLFVLHLLGW